MSYDPKATFEEQLEKCRVGYFDFYLLHNIYENSIKTYADSKWGIIDYFLEQKKIGRIRHFGFFANVKMILSGMTNMEQVQDNIKTFFVENPLNADEVKLIEEVTASMLDLLPCTACRYCCDSCPQNIDISEALKTFQGILDIMPHWADMRQRPEDHK